MEPNEKESFWTKTKNTFKKNNYFWTKIASAILAGIIVIILIICLATCNGHNHKYDSAWSSDETNHWHQATCEHDKKKDLAAHTYGDWVIVTEATETTKGSKKRVCSVCSYVDTAEIAVIPHTHSLVHHEAVDATHATKGNIEYWLCSGCGKYFSDAAGTTEIADKTSVEVKYFSKGLEYTLSSDGASYLVSGIGTCTDTDIVIPSTYEGKDVTGIKSEAFYENETLTSVVMPNSVTSIGMGAFRLCTSIASVVIPNSVTSIVESAFSGCWSLTTLYYDGTIKDWLSIECGEDARPNTNIDFKYFYIKDENGTEEYNGSKYSLLKEVVIPSGITAIPDYAFIRCSSITSITISEGVTSIGNSAFYGCSGLTSVTIPDGVTRIGEAAFCKCAGLTSIVIPKTVTSIGYIAFNYCESLTAVYYKGTKTEWDAISIDSSDGIINSVTKYYYSETAEVTDYTLKYWHYVDGVPTAYIFA